MSRWGAARGFAVERHDALPEALRHQAVERFRARPFGERTLDWCEMLVRARIPRLELVYLPVTRGGELLALGIVHVVRSLDLADYLGAAVRRSLAALARSRVRPLAMDVGFFEVPLCNRPGVLFADGGGAADRAAIALAVIAEAAVTRHDRHGQASRWSDRDVGLPV